MLGLLSLLEASTGPLTGAAIESGQTSATRASRGVCRPCAPSKDSVMQHERLGSESRAPPLGHLLIHFFTQQLCPEPAQCWAAGVHRQLGSWFKALTSSRGHRRRSKASVRAKRYRSSEGQIACCLDRPHLECIH